MNPQIDNGNFTARAYANVLEDAIVLEDRYANASAENQAALIEQWGLSLARHLELEKESQAYAHNASLAPVAGYIGHSLIAFFEAAQKMLLVLPWKHTRANPSNPALTGLVAIIDAVCKDDNHLKRGSPTVAYALNTMRWNPDALWLALNSTQELAQSQLAFDNKDWRIQPFWRWTAHLGVQASLTDWIPNDNHLSDKMWYVTPFVRLPNPNAAVAAMAEKLPWSFGAALEFYQDEPEEDVSQNMIESIFTMDLAKANARLSTELLLNLMYGHAQYQAYGAGLDMLQQRHPDLYAAFQLQVSLHDDIYDAEKYAPICVEFWNYAIYGKTMDSVALPDLGFEGP